LIPVFDLSPIGKTALFASFTEEERRFVIAHSGIVQVRDGGRLFSAGERAEHFYLLLEGSIRIYRSLPEGGSHEAACFVPGDTIGDFDFACQGTYDAMAKAAADSLLIMFPGFGLTLDSISLEEPEAVTRVLLASILMTTSRIKKANKTLVENMSLVQEQYRRAYEDPGTGLWKQSFLTGEIHNILESPSALIMLKPDRFKILVDSRGHAVGDEAMIRIANVLKNYVRRFGRGWALRFKSNEVGVFINNCGSSQAEKIAGDLFQGIAELEPFPPQGDLPAFVFSASLSYSVWPEDYSAWEALFQGCYRSLLETWKTGGGRVVHYREGDTL
jgi:diguanylate cyclase (GGDEF)-like protein